MEKENIKPNWVRGSCIGKGSFGTVNVAVDKSEGHVFAVKSVERTSCQVEALEKEIQFLKSLSSPYVVKYLGDDVTFESNTTFRNLHVEYMPGGTLTGADVDECATRMYTWCIVSALSYVHSKGIVHCDIKGQNVLVGPTPGTAKLADFGSAVQFGAINPPRGSPLWMAPEVIRGEYQGPESDVWSLGCTIIEMVTGKPAWEDKGLDTLCQIGYSNELPAFPRQLSEMGLDFLEKCLRRNPSERWSCDLLLKHPFLLSCSPAQTITNYSPKCVLDCFNSVNEQTCETQELNCNAKERIRELASNTGAIWESDGWEVVRNFVSDGVQGEGTSSVYSGLLRTEEETLGTNLEYLDSSGNQDLGAVEAGCSCRYGLPNNDWAVEIGEEGNNSCCNLKLFCFLLFYINYVYSTCYYIGTWVKRACILDFHSYT